MLSEEAQQLLGGAGADKKWRMECVRTFMKGKGERNVYHYFQKRNMRTFKNRIMTAAKMFKSGSMKKKPTIARVQKPALKTDILKKIKNL